MAAPGDYLDAADLKNVASGGLIKEDVLESIFDVSDIPTEFLDLIGTDSYGNPYSEWQEDELAAPDITNKVISGSDSSGTNNADLSKNKRVGNHAQISTKEVYTTERAQNVDIHGRSDEMGYQTARRLQELRRDVEAIVLTGQGSVQDNGDSVAGQTAGVAAWIKTNVDLGDGGAVGGFNTSTKLVAAYTPGAARALTWEMVATQIENVYKIGGNPSILTSVPGVTKRLGRYLFTTPWAAQPTANVNGSGGGVNQTSQGYIDTFKTDFGTLMQIVPNRLQQVYDSDEGEDPSIDVAHVFGLDPRYWKLGLLYGWKVEPLAKKGLSHRKMLHVDYMLKSFLERANFMIADINPTSAVTAGT